MIVGHDRAIEQFLGAWRGGRLHHAWLLAGPRGVGKASFARMAAAHLLANAAGPPTGPELLVPDDHPTARLLAAGSHPDFRLLERLEKDKGGLARNISIDQVRGLHDMLSVTPSMSPWRAIIVDAADDLEASAANALLKMLEEPPAHTVFFLVAHAQGRMLPTIRSRCRRLHFEALSDAAMTSLCETLLPNGVGSDLIRLAGGSPGRALAGAELNLGPLHAEARAISRDGDPDNLRRSKLASSLSAKSSAERYAAFIALIPGLIADEARTSAGPRRARALDAYARARDTVALAPRLSMDAGATVFHLSGILASIADKPVSLKR